MPSMCVGVDVLLEGLEEKFCGNHTDLAEQQLPFRFVSFSGSTVKYFIL